jgi:Na+/H+ antiporter
VETIGLVIALLAVATILIGVARKLRIPDPMLLVVAGLGIALLPNAPDLELEPDLVFLLFLPPILYAAGYFTSIRDFKANLRPILLLSVGLVLFTTVAVAVVARALVPDMPWAAAFALGAIVSPPDAVAAAAVFQRLGVPRRIVTILEGESLVNDATALVTLNTAIAAAAGSVTLLDAGFDLVVVAVGGIAIGLLAGWLVNLVLRRIDDAIIGILFTLLVPATIFLAAEQARASGVLAVVVAGIIGGRLAARTFNSAQRVQGLAVWQMVLFVINALVFILIGLQLPVALEELSERGPSELLGLAFAVSLTVIVARFIWVFPATYLPRFLSASLRARDPYPSPRAVIIIGWAGMRGVVSLAAALALPPDFPERDLILFLTFAVILATLVVQGLTLPLLIRALGVTRDTGDVAEEREARRAANDAAVERIGLLATEWPEHVPLIDQLRTQYEHRLEHIAPAGDEPRDESERELLEHRIIRREVIDAERDAIISLRDRGVISDEILRRIERDLDLEELRLEA